MGFYDPPSDYAIPNPLGPRLHNWAGGPYNEGSLYHGPVYTRPAYNLPWMKRPLFGTDDVAVATSAEKPSAVSGEMVKVLLGGVVAFGCVYLLAELFLPKRRGA